MDSQQWFIEEMELFMVAQGQIAVALNGSLTAMKTKRSKETFQALNSDITIKS